MPWKIICRNRDENLNNFIRDSKIEDVDINNNLGSYNLPKDDILKLIITWLNNLGSYKTDIGSAQGMIQVGHCYQNQKLESYTHSQESTYTSKDKVKTHPPSQESSIKSSETQKLHKPKFDEACKVNTYSKEEKDLKKLNEELKMKAQTISKAQNEKILSFEGYAPDNIPSMQSLTEDSEKSDKFEELSTEKLKKKKAKFKQYRQSKTFMTPHTEYKLVKSENYNSKDSDTTDKLVRCKLMQNKMILNQTSNSELITSNPEYLSTSTSFLDLLESSRVSTDPKDDIEDLETFNKTTKNIEFQSFEDNASS
ncbi:98_t:CDS:2 [Gigaspora margarita]|uniref:98_t:CDS:1 n=1 Tax=Gigaspora margarita TaxID=4874 RepID=A0ABN7UQE8_GIGMA|nr:98_t:CDS:2 [Gigaspora margarita]